LGAHHALVTAHQLLERPTIVAQQYPGHQ
jgi:hypothetical protein